MVNSHYYTNKSCLNQVTDFSTDIFLCKKLQIIFQNIKETWACKISDKMRADSH